MKNLLSFNRYSRMNETVGPAVEPIEVTHLTRRDRQNNPDVVRQLANIIHENEAQSEYTELHMPKFVKDMGSNLKDKRHGFFSMLMTQPNDLYVVKFAGKIVGFILFIEPGDGKNRIGFGINSKYAGKGILLKAFNQIKDELEYPIYGETSQDNIGSQRLMTKMGFEKIDNFNFAGLPSFRYVKSHS